MKREKRTFFHSSISENCGTTFDFYDMMDNITEVLTLTEIERLCAFLNMNGSIEKINRSSFPQREFLLECRRKNIFTRNKMQSLLEAAHKCGLNTVVDIIEKYQRISCHPGGPTLFFRSRNCLLNNQIIQSKTLLH